MGTFSPFCYRAWVRKPDWKTGQLVSEGAVHDGDSIWTFWDCGVYEYKAANCRLFGINAYELNAIDPVLRQKAVDGRTWLRARLEGKQVFVLSKGLEKYGRPLIIVWENETDFGDNSKSVNALLLQTGLAVPYMGELV